MNELNEAAKLMGKKGGKKTLKNKGKKHFRDMGIKSAEARKALKLAQISSTGDPLDNQQAIVV